MHRRSANHVMGTIPSPRRVQRNQNSATLTRLLHHHRHSLHLLFLNHPQSHYDHKGTRIITREINNESLIRKKELPCLPPSLSYIPRGSRPPWTILLTRRPPHPSQSS